MFSSEIYDLARRLVSECAATKRKIATAESCTGGLIAAALTDIAGASQVFERGYVVYGDDAKAELLDIAPGFIQLYGAVSAEVAEAMALGALAHAKADFALSVTGIAGPGGGSSAKPVGLVYIGLARSEGAVFHYKCHFKGDRGDIRAEAVKEALRLLVSSLDE